MITILNREIPNQIEELSNEQFEAIISEDEKRMAIIDVHLDWCGPCICMTENWQTIWFGMDEPETRISFWQV